MNQHVNPKIVIDKFKHLSPYVYATIAFIFIEVYEVIGIFLNYISLNCQYWDTRIWSHMIASIFVVGYHATALWSLLVVDQSEETCRLAWKIGCSVFIATVGFIYLFYFGKQRVIVKTVYPNKSRLSVMEWFSIFLVVGMGAFWMWILYWPGRFDIAV